MTKLWFAFMFCLVPMEALWTIPEHSPEYSINRRSSCSQPEMANGHARLRQRGRMVRFICSTGYELVGDKYATCRGGRWDVPTPVCVRIGCSRPKIQNAFLMPAHGGAWFNIFCYPGYKGSTTMYCDGRKWNGTMPTCVPDTKQAQLSCDFESPDICGWVQDERHDFDWTRINKKTPSAFLFTGPAFDHTHGEGESGYFMYIESSSKAENDTARLISPVYDGNLEKNGCFSFFYHMYGKSTGGLRVYQIPESRKDQILNEQDTKNQYLLFEKWGNQGDTWYRNVSKLRDVSDNFQIMIEGIRGSSFTSDIAIDDVALLTGAQCDEAIATAVTPSTDISESCAGRCTDVAKHQVGCGCSISCITDGDCCSDFLDVCVFNPDSGNTDDDDSISTTNTSDAPRTEKLIAPTTQTTTTTTSTTTTTTTTPKPTTTTPKPTTTTPKTTTVRTTKAPPTTSSRPVIQTSTKTTTTTVTTVGPTAKFVKLSTTTLRPVRFRQDIEKAKKEESLLEQTAQLAKKQSEGSSGSAVLLVVLLLLVICLVSSALFARSARGRAALAHLRGRTASDPEVRYLTQDYE